MRTFLQYLWCLLRVDSSSISAYLNDCWFLNRNLGSIYVRSNSINLSPIKTKMQKRAWFQVKGLFKFHRLHLFLYSRLCLVSSIFQPISIVHFMLCGCRLAMTGAKVSDDEKDNEKSVCKSQRQERSLNLGMRWLVAAACGSVVLIYEVRMTEEEGIGSKVWFVNCNKCKLEFWGKGTSLGEDNHVKHVEQSK